MKDYKPWPEELKRRLREKRIAAGGFWTDERCETAKKMWAAGATQHKIADALGCTKNQVAGFIFRERLMRSGGIKIARERGPALARVYVRREVAEAFKLAARPPVFLALPAPRPVPVLPPAVTQIPRTEAVQSVLSGEVYLPFDAYPPYNSDPWYTHRLKRRRKPPSIGDYVAMYGLVAFSCGRVLAIDSLQSIAKVEWLHADDEGYPLNKFGELCRLCDLYPAYKSNVPHSHS